jgi:hypothetical protein
MSSHSQFPTSSAQANSAQTGPLSNAESVGQIIATWSRVLDCTGLTHVTCMRLLSLYIYIVFLIYSQLVINHQMRDLNDIYTQVKRGGVLRTALSPHYRTLVLDITRDFLPLECVYRSDAPFWTDSRIFNSRSQVQESWQFLQEFTDPDYYTRATLAQLRLVHKITVWMLSFYDHYVFLIPHKGDHHYPHSWRKFYILFFSSILTSFRFSLSVAAKTLKIRRSDLVWL